MPNKFIRTIIAFSFLGSILLLCYWIRVQGTERIPPGQFTENDAYFHPNFRTGTSTAARYAPMVTAR